LLPRRAEDGDLSLGQRAEGGGDRGLLRQRRELPRRQAVQGLDPRRDRGPGPQGTAPGVRDVEPGRPLPQRGGLRRLPHALRPRRRAQGVRPLGPQPAPERQPGLPDLPSLRGERDPGPGGSDPEPEPRPDAAGGEGVHRDAGRLRRGEEPRGHRRTAGRRPQAPAEGAVATGLRRRGEQHGLPRSAGGGTNPRRVHRLRSPGADRRRSGGQCSPGEARAALRPLRTVERRTIMSEALFWHRVHFAFPVPYPYLFPQLTMGLALLIVLLKWRAYRSGSAAHDAAARFWARIFGINFAVGVVTGIPLEFQFGTNWSRFSQF